MLGIVVLQVTTDRITHGAGTASLERECKYAPRLKPGIVVIHVTTDSITQGWNSLSQKRKVNKLPGATPGNVVIHVTSDRITHTGLEQPPSSKQAANQH